MDTDYFPGARLCEPQQPPHCQPPQFISCAFWLAKPLRVTDPRSAFTDGGCVGDQPQRVVVRKIIGLPDALRLIPLRGTQPLSA